MSEKSKDKTSDRCLNKDCRSWLVSSAVVKLIHCFECNSVFFQDGDQIIYLLDKDVKLKKMEK